MPPNLQEMSKIGAERWKALDDATRKVRHGIFSGSIKSLKAHKRHKIYKISICICCTVDSPSFELNCLIYKGVLNYGGLFRIIFQISSI